jgi:hypothetical protein
MAAKKPKEGDVDEVPTKLAASKMLSMPLTLANSGYSSEKAKKGAL